MSARRRPPSSTPPWSSGRGGRKFAFSISGCNPAALARAASKLQSSWCRETQSPHTRTNSGVIPKLISCPITKRASDVTPGNREPKAHPHHCVKKEQAPHEAPELELGIECGHALAAGCCKSCKWARKPAGDLAQVPVTASKMALGSGSVRKRRAAGSCWLTKDQKNSSKLRHFGPDVDLHVQSLASTWGPMWPAARAQQLRRRSPHTHTKKKVAHLKPNLRPNVRKFPLSPSCTQAWPTLEPAWLKAKDGQVSAQLASVGPSRPVLFTPHPYLP